MTGRHAHKEDRLGAFGCVEVRGDCANSNIRRLRIPPRRSIKIDAVARIGHYVGHVEVRNISQGGAGLRIAIPAAPGEVIVLHLEDGRQIDCRVRWLRMGFCGVDFLTGLELGDALLDGRPPPRNLPAGAFAGQKTVGAGLQGMPSAVRHAVRYGFIGLRGVGAGYAHSASRLRRRLVARRMLGRLRRAVRMLERACRKQGFLWLVEFVGIARQPATDRSGSALPMRSLPREASDSRGCT